MVPGNVPKFRIGPKGPKAFRVSARVVPPGAPRGGRRQLYGRQLFFWRRVPGAAAPFSEAPGPPGIDEKSIKKGVVEKYEFLDENVWFFDDFLEAQNPEIH